MRWSPRDRQLALLVGLLRSRRSMTRAELWRLLPGAWQPKGSSVAAARRKFERDKRALRLQGVELRYDAARGCYSLDPAALRLGRLDLTAAEATLLQQAAAAAVEDPAFPFAPEALGALVRLLAAAGRSSPLADAPSDLVVHHPSRELAEHPELQETLRRVLLAVRRRLPLTFRYRRPQWPRAYARSLQPWGVFCRRGRWSVVGLSVDEDDERTYRLSGIEDLKVVGLPDAPPRFERPAGFDPAAAANRPPWRFSVHNPERVVVSTDPDVGPLLARRLGQAVASPDGRRVEVVTTHRDALMTELRQHLPHVRVDGPAPAAEAWRAPLQRLRARHDA